MESIVFLDRDTVNAKIRKPDLECEWTEHGNTSPDQTPERIINATIVITNKVKLTAEILSNTPSVKMIAVAATGTDCVDIAYCHKAGITVSNVRNYSVRSVPEHVFALILALRRNLIHHNEFAKNGGWQTSNMFCGIDRPIVGINGSILGIIGYGSLGKGVAKIAEAIGLNVLLGRRKGADEIRHGYTRFEDVIAQSDVLTLHCPLTGSTRGSSGRLSSER